MNSKKEKKKQKSNFLYYFVKVTGAIPMLLFLRHKVYKFGDKPLPMKKRGNAVLTANHNSFFDPVIVSVVFGRRNLYYLATKDLYNTKLKRFFFERIHCIEVDKQNFSMSSLHEVCDRLKAGKVVTIFPEGQLNHSESEVLSYKWGAVLMAFKGKAPIVPMYIVPRKHWYNRQRIVIGDPIDITELCGKMPNLVDLQKASEYVRQKELELQDYYNNEILNKREK